MKVRHDVPLSDVLWYRIGGTARYLLEVGSAEDVTRAVDFVESTRPARVFVVGLGSNLVFSDDYFDGAVVRIANGTAAEVRFPEPDLVEAFGGVVLDDVIRAAHDRGLVGLAWAGGLPGTVGAGVRGNVGAFGGEIKDSCERAEIVRFRADGCRREVLDHAALDFSYRDSRVKQERDAIVATVSLRLAPADEARLAAAREEYAANIAYRRARHPMEYPNCGSVFKNINRPEQVAAVLSVWPDIEDRVRSAWHGKVSMGFVIGRLGLAGYRVGGAQVSEKHNNFIVNLGGARAADVRAIIDRVRTAVGETFGFVPEVEVEVVE
ncbi:MAG TPA: UDP-N-acetylmuramate dehydrogenase [Thermomicrobiaceae bacterium]|nr:UDP-N-acetylmuramate dehydrogenase [Thermomicrobiaceae bacterium]